MVRVGVGGGLLCVHPLTIYNVCVCQTDGGEGSAHLFDGKKLITEKQATSVDNGNQY